MPPHDLRRGHDRVVGAERLRAVPGRPVDPQLRPERALLRREHREPRPFRCRHLVSTRLGEHVVGVHGVALVLDEVLRTPGPERLLVGDCEVDEGALRREAGARQPAEGNRLGRREVQHVDRPAPPHEAVDEVAGIGLSAPPLLVDGDDVGVTHEQQARRVGIGALDARDEARASGLRLEPLHVEPGAPEVTLEDVGGVGLVARLDGAVVHALRLDQLLEQVDRLVAHVPTSVDAIGSRRYRSRPSDSCHRSARPASAMCSRCANVSLSAMTPQCFLGKIPRASSCTLAGTEGLRRVDEHHHALLVVLFDRLDATRDVVERVTVGRETERARRRAPRRGRASGGTSAARRRRCPRPRCGG